MKQLEQTQLVETLFQLKEQTHQLVNARFERKWYELMEKSLDDRLHITFTGHFSAGKSTLLNHLVHGDVLPSSPLPTSSNVVMLAKGESFIEAIDYNGNIYKWQGEMDASVVKQLCKRGDVLQAVTIQNESFQLSPDLVLMDSPGIDSTDDDHRKSTESALHLSDVVVYVTDYHHVQSELNLSFIEKLKKLNKTLFVIVNQIDKHDEEELPFSIFCERIEQSMAQVGVDVENIFYTTLKNKEHRFNELQRFEQMISDLISKRSYYIEKNILHSSKQMINEIAEEKMNQIVEHEQISLQDLKAAEETLLSLKENYQKLEDAQVQIKKEMSEFEQSFQHELSNLLKNANITPYDMREQAKQFLTVQDPSFKVGLFFSKKKTEEAREKATNEFLNTLNSLIESEIIWHIRHFTKGMLEKYEMKDPELLKGILALSFELKNEAIKSIVKTGAQVNEQYVIQFSKDISDFIKREVKKVALSLFDNMNNCKRVQWEERLRTIQKKKDDVSESIIAASKWAEEYDAILKWKQSVESTLAGKNDKSDEKVTEWIHEQKEMKTISMELNELPSLLNETEMTENEVEEVVLQDTEKEYEAPEKMASWLTKVAKSIEPLNEFAYIRERLLQKADSISNRSFTIAMFGAFSAGKSSFANALIGNKIFPSSPNPTTAVINKLTKVIDPYRHGDVKIVFKDEPSLLQEVNELLKSKGFTMTELNEIEMIKRKIDQDSTLYQTLSIYEKGIAFWLTQDKLEQIISLDMMEEYVANEEKSCVIQEATIYYDCELTKKGITLVDTPGASSLHQRHTNLAFQYIKESDAIIFLTYFNHPFSKGDEQFLHQLGLVKDSFSLDKMFFIVNAIDLAENNEEAEAVKEYVKERLLTHQIRLPKLFNVSSLAVLKGEKIQHVTNEFAQFEQAFDQFVNHDLTEMMIQSGKTEIKQTVHHLKDSIQLSKLGEKERKQKIEELDTLQKEYASIIENTDVKKEVLQLEQEIIELYHYVKQRLTFRMSDLFKASYEPSKFVQKKSHKEIIDECFDEFINSLNTAFLQEFNATSVRVENYINQLLNQTFDQLSERIYAVPLSNREWVQYGTPQFESSMVELIPTSFEKGHKFFKNAKAFFEQNDRQKLFLLYENELPVVFSQLIEQAIGTFHNYYKEKLFDSWNECQSNALKEISDYAKSRKQTLMQADNHELLEQTLEEVERIIGAENFYE